MFGSGVIAVETLPNHRVEPRATGDGHPSRLALPIENRQTLGTKTPKKTSTFQGSHVSPYIVLLIRPCLRGRYTSREEEKGGDTVAFKAYAELERRPNKVCESKDFKMTWTLNDDLNEIR
ncbi:hypothetical protein L484_025614 [Morus notabilis]|uniref:Uncharacterized protein n=1 Tax=Morus notabilis TaxID=981085 RepID=W9RJC7_9ROSA|nr:hypothetical protein L484_025614 [Morus notabilis]